MGDVVYNEGVAVDTHMMMCLIANSVATVAIVIVMDCLNRAQRRREDDARFAKLCERVEQEREGWAGEREAVLRRVKELETRVLAYQKQLAAQYRQQLIDHQGFIDKRIEGVRFDSTAARLADWRVRDPPSMLASPSPGGSTLQHRHPQDLDPTSPAAQAAGANPARHPAFGDSSSYFPNHPSTVSLPGDPVRQSSPSVLSTY